MKPQEMVISCLKCLGCSPEDIWVKGDSVFYTAFYDNGIVDRIVEIDCFRKASRYKVDDVWSDWEQWTDDEWEFEWEE